MTVGIKPTLEEKRKKKRNDFGLYLESELMTAKYLGQGAIDTVGLYRE